MLVPIIVFIIILSIIVFVHELGHYSTAKYFNVKVEEFGLGIPPKAWGKKIGETVYSINWLPLGGFVRLKGEDYNEQDLKSKDPRSFINIHPYKKAIVLLAGVTMNAILAVFIFYLTLAFNDFRSSPVVILSDYEFAYGQTDTMANVVTFLVEGGSAKAAGVEFGDRIEKLEYNGEVVTPNTVDEMKDFYQGKEGQEVTIYTRNLTTDAMKVLTVVPEYNEKRDAAEIGVGVNNASVLNYTNQKMFSGFLHTANVVGYSFSVLGSLINTSVEEGDISHVAQGVSGPVGLFGAVRIILQTGGPKILTILAELSALLSISLAVMNLLPIPALDGGRLLFVVYEGISGKLPNPKIESRLVQGGFIFLLGLLLLITVKDVFQFFT